MSLTFKQIILWRHAEAEDADEASGENDMDRMLTSKGQRQAKKIAAWLTQQFSGQISGHTMLVSSSAVRAVQTAEALKQKIIEEHALRPSANLQEVLKFLANLEAQNVAEIKAKNSLIIVGHQPWLGQLVTQLTGFSGAEISIKKGAIWWLRLSINTPHKYKVFTVQTPSLLKKPTN
jgi:phosphohistidine phosphatase